MLNAPFAVAACVGQKTPVQLPVPTPVQHVYGTPEPVHNATLSDVRLDVPVVSGFKLIAMFPMNCEHAPPGQSAFVVHVIPLLPPR